MIDSGVDNAEYVTPFVGLILVITTIISIPLMEIAGRRFLHLFGLSGMFVFSIVMTVAMVLKSQYDWMKYINVVGMMVYIFFFAIGPGKFLFGYIFLFSMFFIIPFLCKQAQFHGW